MKKQAVVQKLRRGLWLMMCVAVLCATRTHATVDPADSLDESLLSETDAPTMSNVTIAPTNDTNITTFAPTIANTSAPTAAPVSPAPTSPGTTPAPTGPPVTQPPSPAPTSAASKAPSGDKHKGISFFRFIEKTIAYLILLVLALLGFGAFMANRYRIYFFLRGVWYTILQMECTLWILRKLHIAQYFGYQPVDTSLNSSIFENELNEGLLMRETDT